MNCESLVFMGNPALQKIITIHQYISRCSSPLFFAFALNPHTLLLYHSYLRSFFPFHGKHLSHRNGSHCSWDWDSWVHFQCGAWGLSHMTLIERCMADSLCTALPLCIPYIPPLWSKRQWTPQFIWRLFLSETLPILKFSSLNLLLSALNCYCRSIWLTIWPGNVAAVLILMYSLLAGSREHTTPDAEQAEGGGKTPAQEWQ